MKKELLGIAAALLVASAQAQDIDIRDEATWAINGITQEAEAAMEAARQRREAEEVNRKIEELEREVKKLQEAANE